MSSQSINERILFQLQQDVTDKLNSEPYYATISVKDIRKLQTAVNERDRVLPHLTKKGDKVGCGVLVGFPTIEGVDPNVSGPQGEVLLPVEVFEAPEINFGSVGTEKTCEEVAFMTRAVLHGFAIEGIAALYQDKIALASIPDVELPAKATVGYRVVLRARLSEDSPSKVVVPTITEDTLTITLTNSTVGASIYYTTDDSFPGSGNSAALLYAAPFAVASGTVVRWAAYKTGMIGSDVGRAVIT